METWEALLQDEIAAHEKKIANPPDFGKPYDKIAFANGKSMALRFKSYKAGKLMLEDGKGISKAGGLASIRSIAFRSEAEAVNFPERKQQAAPKKPSTKKATLGPGELKTHMYDVKVSRSDKKKTADFRGGYVDEHAQSVQCTVKMTGKMMKGDVPGLIIKLFVFGKSETKGDTYKIIIREDGKFSLPKNGEAKFESKSVELAYDDQGSARYGHSHYGYVLILYYSDGTELMRKFSRAKLERGYEKYKDMDEGTELRL